MRVSTIRLGDKRSFGTKLERVVGNKQLEKVKDGESGGGNQKVRGI